MVGQRPRAPPEARATPGPGRVHGATAMAMASSSLAACSWYPGPPRAHVRMLLLRTLRGLGIMIMIRIPRALARVSEVEHGHMHVIS